MELMIRRETPADYRAVENLTREAFWGCMDNPTCDGEHLIVRRLRASSDYVPELDLVAEANGMLAGHILYAKAKIVSPDGQETEILGFGPLSVLPSYQKQGVGGALIRYSIREAARFGYRAIVIFGHPDYYPRFGFRPASEFGLTAPDGSNCDAMMALELYKGALNGVRGKFFESSSYEVTPEDVAVFEKEFSSKEPAKLLPIEALTDRLPERTREAILRRELRFVGTLLRFSARELLSWEGMDMTGLCAVNETLRTLGYAEKRPLPPRSSHGVSQDVRKADRAHLGDLTFLASLLWSHHEPQELEKEFSALLSDKNAQFFLLWEGNTAVGFAQCQLRCDYVEGTSTSPVGYLEGIFVKEDCRGKGGAGKLLAACEKWASQCGCREFASDCELDNTDSFRFHLASGFREANRIICFTKQLPEPDGEQTAQRRTE